MARTRHATPLNTGVMKLFLDTADVAVIKDMLPTGMVDGVTTNPSLIAKSGRNIAEVIAEICALVEGPISAEAVATDFETMVKEGDKLAAIAPNVVVTSRFGPVSVNTAVSSGRFRPAARTSICPA